MRGRFSSRISLSRDVLRSDLVSSRPTESPKTSRRRLKRPDLSASTVLNLSSFHSESTSKSHPLAHYLQSGSVISSGDLTTSRSPSPFLLEHRSQLHDASPLFSLALLADDRRTTSLPRTSYDRNITPFVSISPLSFFLQNPCSFRPFLSTRRSS